MYNSIGRNVRMSIFGESHGKSIGVVIEGLPPGEKFNPIYIASQMARRAPGNDATATQRSEPDKVNFLSGLVDGVTTGAPVCAVIENTDTQAHDYSNIADIPRPSHADYPAHIKYNGYNDIRGGGAFSGRLTAPIVVVGAICKQILHRRGISIAGHVYSVGNIYDEKFDPCYIDELLIQKLSSNYFPTINSDIKYEMQNLIADVRDNHDSVGGIVEVAATGLFAGAGAPMFYGVENTLAQLIFGVPAVKGVEFGEGFAFSEGYASQLNDEYDIDMENDNVVTKTNFNGGILGGITTGMPIIVRAAIKPTPSISRTQNSVSLSSRTNAMLNISGRHDPCIVPRAVPVIESCVAFGLLDLLLES